MFYVTVVLIVDCNYAIKADHKIHICRCSTLKSCILVCRRYNLYTVENEISEVDVLTFSPLSPCLPIGPTEPGAPGAPGAPGEPIGPVLPRSPWKKTSKTNSVLQLVGNSCAWANQHFSPKF